MTRKNIHKSLKHEPYDEFKAFLVRKHIKLKEIADLLGHTVQTISMKNNGHTEYTMTEVIKICDKFDISSEIFRSQKIS